MSTDEGIKIILVSSVTKISINISNPNPDIILPSYSLSGQPLVLFQVCSLHFFYSLLQSRHGVLPLTPSTDKTNPVNLPQPLDGNIFNIHFFFLANFFGGLPPFDWTAGSNQLQSGLSEGKLIWGQDEQIKGVVVWR